MRAPWSRPHRHKQHRIFPKRCPSTRDISDGITETYHIKRPKPREFESLPAPAELKALPTSPPLPSRPGLARARRSAEKGGGDQPESREAGTEHSAEQVQQHAEAAGNRLGDRGGDHRDSHAAGAKARED